MKKIIFVLAFMMAATICAEGHRHYNRHATISVQTFYDDLSSYGDWINTPEYGYVWRPYFDDPGNFRPYSTNGNWAYTDLGWTWVSNYPWGWATFHYGRWYYDDYLGWMWIPGNEWAPAWVTWGSYNSCWAWAPMGPAMRVHVDIDWFPPVFWWTFVPCSHFYADNWYSYIYTQPVVVNNITYITNIYNYYGNDGQYSDRGWYHGPRVGDVERHLNTRVRKMDLVDADKPANRVSRNDQVVVYRPDVKNERTEVQPRSFRTVDNARTEAKAIRSNPVKVDNSRSRTGETGTVTRSENRVIRNTGNPVPERKPTVNPGSGQRVTKTNNENNSTKPVRIEHPSPSGGNNSGTRNNVIQRSNVNSQQPVRTGTISNQVKPQPARTGAVINQAKQQPARTGAVINPVKPQPASPDRSRGQVERKNDAVKTNAVTKAPARSTSSGTNSRNK